MCWNGGKKRIILRGDEIILDKILQKHRDKASHHGASLTFSEHYLTTKRGKHLEFAPCPISSLLPYLSAHLGNNKNLNSYFAMYFYNCIAIWRFWLAIQDTSEDDFFTPPQIATWVRPCTTTTTLQPQLAPETQNVLFYMYSPCLLHMIQEASPLHVDTWRSGQFHVPEVRKRASAMALRT